MTVEQAITTVTTNMASKQGRVGMFIPLPNEENIHFEQIKLAVATIKAEKPTELKVGNAIYSYYDGSMGKYLNFIQV